MADTSSNYYTKTETDKLLIETQQEIINSIKLEDSTFLLKNFGIEGQGLKYDSLSMTIDSIENV